MIITVATCENIYWREVPTWHRCRVSSTLNTLDSEPKKKQNKNQDIQANVVRSYLDVEDRT